MRRRETKLGAGRPASCLLGRLLGRLVGRLVTAALALLVVSAGPRSGLAQEFVGRPQVIDAGTLDFSGRRVRLFGIDAPDLTQTCRLPGQVGAQVGAQVGGQVADLVWTCGRDARWAAVNRIYPHWVSWEERGRDPQGAEVAICYLAGFGQHELNVWLVAQGWALAAPGAPEAYTAAQATAEAAGRGLWRGEFLRPSEWRQGKRLP